MKKMSEEKHACTHERDEFVLELIIKSSNHHFHSIPDFPHPLILRPTHSLNVLLLKNKENVVKLTQNSSDLVSLT